ncbi:hypothetical protein [Nocardia farcinica]|uniref:hypothetical protein n=1 Tax=Nocardia farcinica TaxID=37329 RepID=UPI0024552707|nr:hypothetical protein [Nocardia farcinica]
MEVDRVTVPGTGVLHHLRTRAGVRFALLTRGDDRQLLVYDQQWPDEPAQTITLAPDEADQLADLLHSAPLPDRVARLERRMSRLLAERDPA